MNQEQAYAYDDLQIRKLITFTEKRREILHAVGWQVMQNIWSSPTDVYETEKGYIVRVEIAGMREEDFEIIFENGYLFISGVRPDVSERRAYHQMEIRFGKFSTTIVVPEPSIWIAPKRNTKMVS